jgi:uncharacterized damage-inducible protein DinB
MNTPPTQPDPWLRGPVAGIPALLQPVAHALIAAREEIDRTIADIGRDELWARPGGVASLGFHVAHLSGATDRLLTYARGEALSESQRADLVRERAVADTRPEAETLLVAFRETIRRGLDQLAATDESTLTQPRAVGRAQAASTVLGLLFHAADHAARHSGQIVTTARLVRAGEIATTPA